MANGFWKYDIGRDHWINLETRYRAEHALSVRSDIYAILQDGKAIWFGTNLGLCRHEAGSDTYETIEGTTAAIAALAKHGGKILCGTKQSGLLAYDPGSRTWSDLGRRYPIPSSSITALACEDRQIWVGTEDGLSVIDCRTGKLLSLPQELTKTPVSCLLVQRGVAWVGTPDGLLSFRVGQKLPTRYGRDANLPDASITSLMPGSDGLLIGTRKGLALLTAGSKQALPDKQFEDHLVSALTGDARYLWVATLGQGLVRVGKTATR
jgi:ligand-binding sensor domain-containing protein